LEKSADNIDAAMTMSFVTVSWGMAWLMAVSQIGPRASTPYRESISRVEISNCRKHLPIGRLRHVSLSAPIVSRPLSKKRQAI
jgi:hypothetical protein